MQPFEIYTPRVFPTLEGRSTDGVAATFLREEGKLICVFVVLCVAAGVGTEGDRGIYIPLYTISWKVVIPM